MASVCVLVPTYKRPNDLAGLLACLRPQIEHIRDRRLIVVNDGTHDEAYAAVVRPHLTWMTYLIAPQNGGPAAARNYGAREIEEDFILMTDDDCRPPKTWVDYAQSRFETQPWLDGLAGYTRPVFSNPKSLRERVIAGSDVLPGATYDEIGRLTCAVTAAFAVRRAAFEAVGGFDESFRPSGEDLDLTQRILRAGFILEADKNWWTGHTTADTIKSYIKRYYTYGEGSARYAMRRKDWIHPDLRNYLDDADADETVKGWLRSTPSKAFWKQGTWVERIALYLFVKAVAEAYADGFAAGVETYGPQSETPPSEPWLRWPRLGLAADGLPRR
jgi:glycosyltransferase involved in cell wall biosynthesis